MIKRVWLVHHTHMDVGYTDMPTEVMDQHLGHMDAALDLCDVDCGRFDGFWELNLNAWDVAAGSLIIEEAGGRWSGVRGDTVDLYAREFLGTNGLIHDEMVKIITRKVIDEAIERAQKGQLTGGYIN